MIKGDSAAAKAQMSTMMDSPEKYSAAALFELAGAQYTSGEYASAVKLYEVGLSKNPMFQPGVLSYISALLRTDDFSKAIPAARTLISIDPNGQGSLLQAAATWQKVMLSTTDTVQQKMATDSTLHYVTASRESPVYVKVVEFVPSIDGASFDAQVNNQTDAAKTYELEVEFLNATGGVVASSKASFKVDAKGAQRSTIKGTGEGIVAWRYKPLK
jgi:hypothetical protein